MYYNNNNILSLDYMSRLRLNLHTLHFVSFFSFTICSIVAKLGYSTALCGLLQVSHLHWSDVQDPDEPLRDALESTFMCFYAVEIELDGLSETDKRKKSYSRGHRILLERGREEYIFLFLVFDFVSLGAIFFSSSFCLFVSLASFLAMCFSFSIYKSKDGSLRIDSEESDDSIYCSSKQGKISVCHCIIHHVT